MKIYESAEMYLETILVLSKESSSVRMIDVANAMNFSKPSVSVFLKELRENGYIKNDENGHISLTDSGRLIAERIYERHQLITKFLTALGVSPEVAAHDACKMEHDISDETFTCMKAHYERYSENTK